ncbi:GTP pyrophosphokinase [Gammaproteobacteria bacterium 42_54_T18]|nr:GTP pyrophosphokinase [Gammaproteobacteria bacterium 42_54_T18]
MANKQYQEQKKPLQFSKGSIDRAGRDIRHEIDGNERVEAIKKIQNFREFHLYPLMLMKNHLSRTSDKVGGNIVVARRLKQLPTIIDKLERPALNPDMRNSTRVTSMQDIAGCRAIVKNLKQLNELKEKLLTSRSVHRVVRVDDYLSPKDSGYGGVHLIYNCFEASNEISAWKNAKVEVQLRTDLQHSWATSLEIIDTLEEIKLKTSLIGHTRWRRFFSLAGSLVANDEGAIQLLESEVSSKRSEMISLSIELDILNKLQNYAMAISVVGGSELKKKYKYHKGLFLISIKRENNIFKVRLKPFKMGESNLALEALNDAELNKDNDSNILVDAENARTLRKSYPNYFGSTTKFIKFMSKHMLQALDSAVV